MEQLHTMAKRI